MMIRSYTVITVFSLLAAFSAQAADTGEPAAPLTVSAAWVRAMPPGQKMTAGYLQISNPGTQAVIIQSLSSDQGMASLHETTVVDGRSSMRALDSLTLAPGESVALSPGGMHVMFMGLDSMPAEGETLGLCLQTSAGEQCLDMPVQRSGDAMSGHSHHQQ